MWILLPLRIIRIVLDDLRRKVPQLVSYAEVARLEEEERRLAELNQLEEYKFDSNQEMLAVIKHRP